MQAQYSASSMWQFKACNLLINMLHKAMYTHFNFFN